MKSFFFFFIILNFGRFCCYSEGCLLSFISSSFKTLSKVFDPDLSPLLPCRVNLSDLPEVSYGALIADSGLPVKRGYY